jgi:hypothetical protein
MKAGVLYNYKTIQRTKGSNFSHTDTTTTNHESRFPLQLYDNTEYKRIYL